MMQAHTPKLGDFEGLVYKTARMFASQVKMEEEDLRQELRVIAWKAMASHHGGGSLEGYVFWCITNKIKDYKRNAARRAEYGVSFGYIEEHRPDGGTLDHFEATYLATVPDQVYGHVDEGLLTLPATLTECETNVLVLLMFDMTEREIRLRLVLSRVVLESITDSIRVKLADWHPSRCGERRVAALAAVAA